MGTLTAISTLDQSEPGSSGNKGYPSSLDLQPIGCSLVSYLGHPPLICGEGFYLSAGNTVRTGSFSNELILDITKMCPRVFMPDIRHQDKSLSKEAKWEEYGRIIQDNVYKFPATNVWTLSNAYGFHWFQLQSLAVIQQRISSWLNKVTFIFYSLFHGSERKRGGGGGRQEKKKKKRMGANVHNIDRKQYWHAHEPSLSIASSSTNLSWQ